jgi:hypothetical protein
MARRQVVIEVDIRIIEEVVDLTQVTEVEVVISIKAIVVVLIIIFEEVLVDHHKM